MSTYPIDVVKVSLDHKGGSKSYHLTLLNTADNKSVLIRRWGKKGVFGDVKVETYNDVGSGETAYASLMRQKNKGGYDVVSRVADEGLVDIDEVMKIVGRPTWARLSADQLKFIDSLLDTSGVREPDPPRFKEDGSFIGDPEPRKIVITEEMKEQARRDELAEMRKLNPNAGRF